MKTAIRLTLLARRLIAQLSLIILFGFGTSFANSLPPAAGYVSQADPMRAFHAQGRVSSLREVATSHTTIPERVLFQMGPRTLGQNQPMSLKLWGREYLSWGLWMRRLRP